MAALAFTLRHQRWLLAGALLVITCLSLSYTYWLATGFDMSAMMSPTYVPWSPGYFVFMLVMWIVMMIGMMTPSVAPTVMLYAEFARRSGGQAGAFPPGSWFAGGYLLAWAAFALLATLLQWLLEWLSLITPMMAGTSKILAGAMLVAAGAYQWLPLKQSCLAQCRSPLSFIQRQGGFQQSARGAARLGFLHGSYCIGCCWALMLLLFAFGVMELRWIAGLMVYVLLEKLLPLGPRAVATFARATGVIAMIAGAWLMVR